MSKDETAKTDKASKPMTDEEARKAVGGAMPSYSDSREKGDPDTVQFRRYRR